MTIHKTECGKIYTLFEPDALSLPLLVDSPHSGRHYPEDFQYACDFRDLQPCEDNHLDALLQNCVNFGATYLQCEFPRSYIDVNRAADDIDPALLRTPPQNPINPTARSSAGYGLIRRLIRPGKPIYERLLEASEIQKRLEDYYMCYHNILQQKIDMLHYNFGQVFYLNMHSMPETSAHTEDGHPVDFVLGDRHGTTCRRDFVHMLRRFLENQGYRVSLNDPYKGVELIKRHGHPASGKNALQIEINKNLYWDDIKSDFKPAAYRITDLLSALFSTTQLFIKKELVQLAAD